MKKKCMALFLVLFVLMQTMIFALTMDDLNDQDRANIEEYITENFDDITLININQLEGSRYILLFENNNYVLIEIDGELYVVYKD